MLNRRQFMKRVSQAAGTVAFPCVLTRAIGAQPSRPAASNRVTVGFVGMGGMGNHNLGAFLGAPDVQVVAVCDVDANHLAAAGQRVNEHYGNLDCTTYADFRELMARPDIDAVCLSLPDHWHAVAALTAVRAGKDVYGEKPITHTLREGRLLADAVRQYGRIWQTGSWQRSVRDFRHACELVRNGRIGKVTRVEVGLLSGPWTEPDGRLADPPPQLDYDTWVGPAPYVPYCEARVHGNWRWYLDFGGGQLMDWVGHHVDIAHWGLGLDRTGPVEVEATGEFPAVGVWNSAVRYRVRAVYADGLEMIVAGGYDEIAEGTKWIGTDGWVHVDRGLLKAEPEGLLAERFTPADIRLYHSDNHMRNFIDCVKSRRETITPAEVAHRSASVGHLGHIAMVLGRKLRWRPETEEIVGDPTAARLLGQAVRAPWRL